MTWLDADIVGEFVFLAAAALVAVILPYPTGAFTIGAIVLLRVGDVIADERAEDQS